MATSGVFKGAASSEAVLRALSLVSISFVNTAYSGRLRFIKDWVEKKIRHHMGRSRNRRGFGWKRWSRRRLYEKLKLFNGYRVRRASAPKALPA